MSLREFAVRGPSYLKNTPIGVDSNETGAINGEAITWDSISPRLEHDKFFSSNGENMPISLLTAVAASYIL